MSVAPLLLLSSLAPAQPLPPEVQAIFAESCAMCHDASDELDLVDLEEAGAERLLDARGATGESLIVPGDPARSYLYEKLTGAEGIEGEPMPLDEDPLPPEQLATISAWIGGLAAAPSDAADPTATSPPTAAPVQPATAEPPPATTIVPPSADHARPRPRKPFLGTHQVNLHTTTTLGPKTLEFRVHHRFGRFGSPKDRSYAGLASGAIISWGMAYGIVDGLDAMLRWTSSYLDWELGLKYVPLRQEEGAPLSLGAWASFEALTDFPENAANPVTGNFQLMVSRLWRERWSTQLTFGYSMFTNHAPRVDVDFGDGAGPTPVRDRRGTLDLGLASTLWFGKKKNNGIDLEYILPVPDAGDPDLFYRHGGDADPDGSPIGGWSLGWTGKAGLHLFQVFLTNTRNIHTNLVAPGGDTKNPFKPFGEFFLGFNLSRQWKL